MSEKVAQGLTEGRLREALKEHFCQQRVYGSPCAACKALSLPPSKAEDQAKALLMFRQAVILQRALGVGRQYSEIAQIAAIKAVEAADQACEEAGL